jgi:hypothetical protein
MNPSPLLLQSSNQVSQTNVLTAVPRGNVIVCDCKIEGVEAWEEKPWGYESGRVINIDHHAQTPLMRRYISSANLAALYVAQNGAAKSNETVIINHTDCDSVLSAAIMCGDVEPLPEYGEAAIAADHTGKVNPIADLLQALDAKRDYAFSLRNLRLLLDGSALDDEADVLLQKRHGKRALASKLVEDGKFTIQNGLAWAVLDDTIDSEFFPALLPDAIMIATFSPRPNEPGKWNAKFRLGTAAPGTLWVEKIIQPIDAKFGGRWNAGSNKRGGGSSISPSQYAAKIMATIQNDNE